MKSTKKPMVKTASGKSVPKYAMDGKGKNDLKKKMGKKTKKKQYAQISKKRFSCKS